MSSQLIEDCHILKFEWIILYVEYFERILLEISWSSERNFSRFFIKVAVAENKSHSLEKLQRGYALKFRPTKFSPSKIETYSKVL